MTFADFKQTDITQYEFDLFNNYFYLKRKKNLLPSEQKLYLRIGDKIFNSPDLLIKFRKFEYLEKYFSKKECFKSYNDYLKENF